LLLGEKFLEVSTGENENGCPAHALTSQQRRGELSRLSICPIIEPGTKKWVLKQYRERGEPQLCLMDRARSLDVVYSAASTFEGFELAIGTSITANQPVPWSLQEAGSGSYRLISMDVGITFAQHEYAALIRYVYMQLRILQAALSRTQQEME
jgi:hypothetical protein